MGKGVGGRNDLRVWTSATGRLRHCHHRQMKSTGKSAVVAINHGVALQRLVGSAERLGVVLEFVRPVVT